VSSTPAGTRAAAVVLLSGGMDSVTALYDAMGQHQVVGALSFHYGAKHNDREIPFASRHAARFGIPHRVIELGFIGNCLIRICSNPEARSRRVTTRRRR
jgi:7-cyano-7-deazaguanine synthase